MAYLASLIINTARTIHGKRGIKMTSPIDYMPNWDPENQVKEVKKQSVEEMKQALVQIAKSQNKSSKKIASRKDLDKPNTQIK